MDEVGFTNWSRARNSDTYTFKRLSLSLSLFRLHFQGFFTLSHFISLLKERKEKNTEALLSYFPVNKIYHFWINEPWWRIEGNPREIWWKREWKRDGWKKKRGSTWSRINFQHFFHFLWVSSKDCIIVYLYEEKNKSKRVKNESVGREVGRDEDDDDELQMNPCWFTQRWPKGKDILSMFCLLPFTFISANVSSCFFYWLCSLH